MHVQKRSCLYSPLIIFLTLGLLFAPVIDTIPVLIASQEDKCAAELEEAQNKYQLGELDAAINLVTECLAKKGLGKEESGKAYNLLGKAYFAKGLLDQAKENLEKLLELIPNWRPNPEIDTPPFQRLAEEVITEIEQKKETELPPAEVRQEEQKQPGKPAIEPGKSEEKPIAKPERPEEELAQILKKGGSKKFLWIGLGAAALGGGIFAFAGGGGGNGNGGPPVFTRLPDPPGDPGN